jgi:hypothetical protein
MGRGICKAFEEGVARMEQALAAGRVLERLEALNSNLLFLPDLHSLNLLEGQLVP